GGGGGRWAGRRDEVSARGERFAGGGGEVGDPPGAGVARAGEKPRRGGGGGRGRQPPAVLGGENHDAIPPLRRSQDSAQRRQALRVEKLRRDAVGGDHEVFDELPRPVFFVGLQVREHVAIEDRARFHRTQPGRAARM